jgi:hypothetical protein
MSKSLRAVTFAGVSSLGSDRFAATLPAGRNLRKGPASFFVHGRGADEVLPAQDRDVDIGRRKFDRRTRRPVISPAMIVVPDPLNGS